jgi:MFS transporter, DHA1 family, multidrug resistance protein
MPTLHSSSPAATPRAVPSSGRRRGPLLVIAGVSMIGPFSVDVYLPAMPTMASRLSTSSATIQLSITTFMIGLALGQLVIGPLSDAFGRRRPLLIGLSSYTISSLACALAPSALALVSLRFVQGIAASAGLVVSLAIVRDLFAGREAARFLSYVRTLAGVGPLAAPVIGAQVLRLTEWRGVFAVQMVFGILLVIAVSRGLRETLPPSLRQSPKLRRALGSLAMVGRDAGFLSYTLPAALMSGAAFSYISGSSFVFQNGYGVSPQTFSLIFSMNVVSMVLAALVNARLVRAIGPGRLFAFGLGMLVAGPLFLLLMLISTDLGIVGVVAALSVCLIGFGFGNPNAMALAINSHPNSAGAAAGLFGILAYTAGAVAAPLGGLMNASTGAGLGLQMLTWAAAAATVHLILRWQIAKRRGSRLGAGATAATAHDPSCEGDRVAPLTGGT